MDAQKLLELYIASTGYEADKYWLPLSDAISNMVKKAVYRKEISDLDDFEEECILSIWTKINALKYGETEVAIDNIEGFVRRIVHNKYCDAIRKKRPGWYYIKLELQEIFNGKANIKGFSYWEVQGVGKLCGFTAWCNTKKCETVKCRELVDDIKKFKLNYLQNRDPHEMPIYELAAAVLDYCGAPVDIDTLTGTIAGMLNMSGIDTVSLDSPNESDDEGFSPADRLVAENVDIEKQITQADYFSKIINWFWAELENLPLKQKKILLYGLGSDQVSALCAGVGYESVAKALGMTKAQLVEIIDDFPVPDIQISQELEMSTRAVPSARFKIWTKIRKKTKTSAPIEIDKEENIFSR